MEDLIGIIIFVAFIVLRTRKDRQQNMNRQKESKTSSRTVRETPSQTIAKANNRRTEPVQSVKTVKKDLPAQYKRKTPEVEGYKAVIAEERKQPKQEKHFKTQQLLGDSSNKEPSNKILTARDLRKAVIWSEVLDKPRFKKRKLNYR